MKDHLCTADTLHCDLGIFQGILNKMYDHKVLWLARRIIWNLGIKMEEKWCNQTKKKIKELLNVKVLQCYSENSVCVRVGEGPFFFYQNSLQLLCFRKAFAFYFWAGFENNAFITISDIARSFCNISSSQPLPTGIQIVFPCQVSEKARLMPRGSK